jgi:hypothetical protein
MTETRAALVTGIVFFIAGLVTVLVFAWAVLDAMPP